MYGVALSSIAVSFDGYTCVLWPLHWHVQDIGLQDTAVEILHALLSYLAKHSEEDSISPDTREAFLVTLRSSERPIYASSIRRHVTWSFADFPIERCPVVLLPLLYREKGDLHMDRLLQEPNGSASLKGRVSMADILREIGYSACSRWDISRVARRSFSGIVSYLFAARRSAEKF